MFNYHFKKARIYIIYVNSIVYGLQDEKKEKEKRLIILKNYNKHNKKAKICNETCM